jgi:hypothetical protein
VAAVAVLLAVTAAAPVLQVLHFSDSTHRCEFCQLGQVPLVVPSGVLAWAQPEPAGQIAETGNSGGERRSTVSWRTPRSPPF